ncbi:MAG: GntR family transcriptional regulator [Planctomycetota bacterium]
MDTSLVRSPVYQQLNQRLRAALATEYRSGDQFLTEREVAEKFHVSRATANKSLASLVSEGFLEFRKGLGTFVRRDVIDYDVRSLVSFTEKARAAGKKPKTELLTFGKLLGAEVEASIRTALRVESETLLWEMERVRLADGVPVILEHRYVVHAHCPKLTKTQSEGSLYRTWTESHGLKIAGANEVIRAVLVTTQESQHLQTTDRSPALEVVSIGFLEDDSPLWWERTLYRGDQYEFHSRLGPIQSATPARGKLR